MPTLVAEYEAPWNNNTTPKTVSATAAANDVFVVVGGTENGNTTVQTPTGGTGITWTQLEAQGTGGTQSTCAIFSATPSAQSWTLSVARSATANWWGFNALRFSNSSGIGAAESTNNGTASGLPTINITTTAANSALVAIVVNWNGGTAEPTWDAINGYQPTVANGGTVSFFGNTNNYAIAAAVWPDVGAAGVKTVSQSTPTGQRYVIAVVEVLHSAGGSSSANPADSLGITDSVTAPADRARAQADPLGLTDSAQTAVAADRTAADSVGLTDSVQVSSGASVAPADSLGIGDAVGLARSISLADAVGATDSAATVASSSVTAADAVGVTDNVAVALSIARTIGDQIGATDSASADLTAPGSANIDDPLGVTDLLTTTAQILRTAADSLGITDGLTIQLERTASRNDPVGLTDSVTVQSGAAPSPADAVGVSDSAVAVVERVVIVADQVGVVDQVSAFNPSIPPLPTDGVSLSVDTGTRGLTLTAEARDMEVQT